MGHHSRYFRTRDKKFPVITREHSQYLGVTSKQLGIGVIRKMNTRDTVKETNGGKIAPR